MVMLVVCKCGGRQFARKPAFAACGSFLLQGSDCNALHSLLMFNSNVKVVVDLPQLIATEEPLL